MIQSPWITQRPKKGFYKFLGFFKKHFKKACKMRNVCFVLNITYIIWINQVLIEKLIGMWYEGGDWNAPLCTSWVVCLQIIALTLRIGKKEKRKRFPPFYSTWRHRHSFFTRCYVYWIECLWWSKWGKSAVFYELVYYSKEEGIPFKR